MSRGQVHTQVADLLDRTVTMNDEKRWISSNGARKWSLKWDRRDSNPRPTDLQKAILSDT